MAIHSRRSDWIIFGHERTANCGGTGGAGDRCDWLHRDIGGNESHFWPRLAQHHDRFRANERNDRVNRINVAVASKVTAHSRQAGIRGGIRVQQQVQEPGEGHHRLQQQEDTEPEGRVASCFAFREKNP